MAYSKADGASEIASSSLTGSAQGAAAGSVAGPWGALIGGIAGGVAGTIGGIFKAWANSNSEKEKQELINRAAKEYNASADQVEAMFRSYYATNPSLGTQTDVETYQNMVRNYDPTQYAYKPTEFEYDKTVDDFIDPYADKVMDAAAKKVSASAAGAGLGRGTGAANAIAQKEAEVYGGIYDKAQAAYQADRSQSYNEFQGYIQNMQNYLNSINANTQFQIQKTGNLAADYQDMQRQQVEDYAQLASDRAKANLQLQLAKV